jgi:hypothetical protein
MKSQHWETPEGYRVNSYCTLCGLDFAGDSYFERHKTGSHQYTYSEGLKYNPPVEDGRRCMSIEELAEIGMRPMTKEEMNASSRHRHRIGFGIPMIFDPSEIKRGMEALDKSRKQA